MSKSPRLVGRGQVHGNGEIDFAVVDAVGVNLFCDADHDRRFVSALIFDEATGVVTPLDGIRKHLERPDGTSYEKWKLRCLECHRVTDVIDENLDKIIATLVGNGVTDLSLAGLDARLRRK